MMKNDAGNIRSISAVPYATLYDHMMHDSYKMQMSYIQYTVFKSLRPRQNGRHFLDIFKCVFVKENV